MLFNIRKYINFNNFGPKTVFFFILAIGFFFYAYLELYQPFMDIPVINIFVTGDMAYQTPMTLLNTYFPLLILLSSFAGLLMVIYILLKNW